MAFKVTLKKHQTVEGKREIEQQFQHRDELKKESMIRI